MKTFLIDCAYLFFFVLWSPWLLVKMLTRGKYRAGLTQRLGFVPRRTGDRPCLWVHGVSVGEVASASTLIEAFSQRFPGWDVVVSTTTDTGQQTARRLYAARRVFYYPLDLSFAVRRTFRRVRPTLICLMELEIWPNFLRVCEREGVPVVLANGVLSRRSYSLHKRFWRLLRGTYGRIRTFAVQTQVYADRLRDLGVPGAKVLVTGNMKYDTIDTAPGDPPTSLAEELGLRKSDRVLVAGSTHPGEEADLLEVYGTLRDGIPRLRLMLVPRHPERFGEVTALVAERGFAVHRRSGKAAPAGGAEPPVILIDTLGELVTMYQFADLVFVGGTLVPVGGHNVMEPAGLGKMPVVGPYTEKSAEAVELLLAEGAAAQVADAEELVQVLAELLQNPERLTRAGERARQVVIENQGATARNLRVLAEVVTGLESAGGGRSPGK